MRKLEFSELKLKNDFNEEKFYQYYLKNLPKEINQQEEFNIPEKRYEIFYLNILGGKILLLNKNYLPQNDLDNQELFYNYQTAYKIYNYWLDIYDGIENEQYEFNELYKYERLYKNSEIEKLKHKDDEDFGIAMYEYNVVKKSFIYTEYLKLFDENQKLKEINKDLLNKINCQSKKEKIGILKKITNKFRNKKF